MIERFLTFLASANDLRLVLMVEANGIDIGFLNRGVN